MPFRRFRKLYKRRPTLEFFKPFEIERRVKFSKAKLNKQTSTKNQTSPLSSIKSKIPDAMDSTTTLDLSPPVDRTMTTLNRKFFSKTIPLVQAFFHDPRDIAKFMRTQHNDVLNIRGVANVIKYPEYGTARGVLLTERLTNLNDAPSILAKGCFDYFKKNNIYLSEYKLKLDYDYWKADEILKAILPEDLTEDIPSGFTQIGHIAHLNLRDEYKPYKGIIGQVILDKNDSVKTVVDKTSTISTKFRTFPMEVLAGEPEFEVKHRESNCTFIFDFSKVYWNSRLQGEHERLIRKFQRGEVLVDVMAGVGPFSVPAGKKDVVVLANDLNPESYHYLQRNIIENKTKTVRPFCEDGHDFIRNSLNHLKQYKSDFGGVIVDTLVKKKGKDKKTKKEIYQEEVRTIVIPDFPHHYVMNLPDSALTFLGDFNGIFTPFKYLKEIEDFQLPMIHVYCFEKFDPTIENPPPSSEELQKRVFEKIKNYLSSSIIEYGDVDFHLVRKVSPSKPMYCCSFRLPEDVAFRETETSTEAETSTETQTVTV